MKKINHLVVAGFLTALILAGASFKAQADSLSSKDAVLRTVIAAPAKANVSGQAVNTTAYNSKGSTKNTASPSTKTGLSAQAIDAAAYSSKAR